MKRISLGKLYYEFDRHAEPRARIRPGESIVVESEDAFSGQIRTESDQRDRTKMPYSNPMTGPVYVEEAEPGDTLTVAIHSIRPTLGKCFTRTGNPRQLGEWLGMDSPGTTRVCEISEGSVRWSETVRIPYTPLLGCIGTSPNLGVPTTDPAGSHGGNMDIVETCPGSTIHLPVFVSGALLYLGDAHAAQGQGELSSNGLEMPAETEITVNLIKGRLIPSPRIVTPTEIVSVASAGWMERSIAQAYAHLILWMESEYGWERWNAYDLLTHVGRISVGYYGMGAVAAKIERRYL